MPRGVRRFSLLSGVALCAILGGPIAVAQASNNSLKQTLNHYGPIIKREEAAVKSGLHGYPGSWKRLVRALGHEVATLHAMKKKLAHESASSAQGSKAKTDIIKGLGLIASAYGRLRTDVSAAHGGSVPPAQVNAAVKTDDKGRKKFLAGLNLLGATP